MAVAPLEQRLNSIMPEAASAVEEAMLPPALEQPTPPQLEIETKDTSQMALEEGTQVAGLIPSLTKSLTKKAPKPGRQLVPGTTPPGELPKPAKVPGTTLIPEADQQLTEKVGQAVGRASSELTGVSPSEAFNLSRYQSEDAAAVVSGVADALGIQTKRVTFDEIKAKAKESGISESFLDRLISPEGKMLPTAVDTYKALEVLESSANELDRLFKLVDSGEATDIDKLQLRQQIALHGLIQKGVKGIQTETARALAVFRIPRDGNAQVIRDVLDEYGGENSLQDMARSYLRLGTREARNNMVEKSMMSSLKDVWFTTYINGMLSSGVTHAKNILGNTMFGLYQIPERAIAGLYSNFLPEKLRSGKFIFESWGDLIPGSAQEKIELDEFLTMAMSIRNGVVEGLTMAGQGFKTGRASDLMSKVEMQRAPTESLGETLRRLSGVGEDGYMGKAFDLYGNLVELPGRALMAEDEFFKGTFYRMQLNALITRRGKAVYRDALAAGDDEAMAMAKAETEMASLFESPPADLDEQALLYAQRGTFTSKLPPNLHSMQKFFNHPIMKIIVPFFKTPANIGLEVVERSPFAFLSSRFRQDVAAGGVHRDMAMAKVTLGSTLMMTFATYAAEGRISGSGPKRQAEREALERTGWKPYSIKVGDNWVSYSGLDPMSAFLAMAADYAEYAQYEDDPSKLEQVFLGSVYGLYEYMKNQPYLQGVAEIANALGLGKGQGEFDPAKAADNLAKLGGQFVIGGSPMPGTSSLVASIERMTNPAGSDVKASPDLPLFVRGFYESFNRYRSRLPYFNDDLPERLNLWGDTVMQANPAMGALTMISPIMVSPEQFSEVDHELTQLRGPIGMPDRRLKGIELSAQQYNRLLTIYGKETPAKQELERLVTSPSFKGIASLESRQERVKALHQKYMDFAQDKLLAEDVSLQMKVAAFDERKKVRGLYTKPERQPYNQ